MELEKNANTQQDAIEMTLPEHGDLDLRQSARVLMEELGLSQNAAAKRIGGMSGTTLSQWLNGKYPANDTTIIEKISKWIENEKLRMQAKTAFPPGPTWVETPTSRKVMNVLAYSQMTSHISVIYGSPGLGKTKGIERYAQLNSNVWVATMSPQMSSVSAALEEIAEAVGLRNVPGRSARIHRELKRKLEGTKGLIVIDEAHHLDVEGLDAIRAIHDTTHIGLALVGNELIYSRLTGGGRRSLNFAQLFSRIGKRQKFLRPMSEDVEALTRAFRIEGKAELAFLKEIAAKPGALRGMTYTMQLATVLAVSDGGKIMLCHLQEAWKDLGGE